MCCVRGRMCCGRGGMCGGVVAVVAALAACAAAHSYCAQLNNTFADGSQAARAVSVQGREHDVVVRWGGESAHAAAALLAAALRYALRYHGVRLSEGPLDLCALVRTIPSASKELWVVPAAAWKREHCPAWCNCDPQRDGSCALGGPALVTLGEAAAPVSVRAYVHLSAAARRNSVCQDATLWTFYDNSNRLRECDFFNGQNSSRAILYVLTKELQNLTEARYLIESMIAGTWAIRLESSNRAALRDLVRSDAASFLLLDWELWDALSGMAAMRAAPPACGRAPLPPRAAPVGVLAASELLLKYATRIYRVVRNFSPGLEALRAVLELGRDGEVEEAACGWAINNMDQFSEWIESNLEEYMVAIFVCKKRSEPDLYKIVAGSVSEEMERELKLHYEIQKVEVNCSNGEEVKMKFNSLTRSTDMYHLAGVVADEAVAREVAPAAATARVVLVSVDATGAADLAAAVARFVHECAWRRLAVLSDGTAYARAVREALGADAALVLGHFDVNASDAHVRATLERMRELDASVVFLNCEAQVAAAVVERAGRLGMTPDAGYAWVAREWADAAVAPPMRVWSVSSRCRGSAEAGEAGEARAALRGRLQRALGARWPLRAAATADALLALGYGFANLIKQHPWARDDPHRKDALSLFWEELNKANVSGVCQQLRYRGAALAEPRFYLHEWVGGHAGPTWLPGAPRLPTLYRDAAPPSDRRSACLVQLGDPYAPHCADMLVACGLVAALVLTAGCVALSRRVLRQRLAHYERQIQLSVLSRRQRSVQALAGYLVPREHLELRGELGAGRSGRVHLALLRTPGRALRAVAAKSLRDDAAPSAESEFLREACTLAALEHEHVVRLVGVCLGDTLLVLMEHAFFGDLLGYLRARRHLAEGADGEAAADSSELNAEEATHVSAEALTRLVRQAASALAYLALRGVVHRDVRAANCLVDARRSLKLGDFGMARETSAAGADGAAEYACRRRGMFPVLWMAPESLKRGAFSAASDVWALGVLVVEVVSLGARPYGAWSPLRVLQWVVGGGRPQLPRDATAATRGVALACWRREASERPRACELVAYLAEHPRALRPALVLEVADAEEAVDSGYGGGYGGFGEPDAEDLSARPSPDSATAFFSH